MQGHCQPLKLQHQSLLEALRTSLNALARHGAINNLNYSRPQHTWLRLMRNGSNFVGYTSMDGSNWSFAFSATVSMTGCIYAGLFAESTGGAVTTTAVFDQASIIGPSSNVITTPVARFVQAAPIPVEFSVFPNPTTGELNVDLSAYANKAIRLEVYDNLGKALQILETETINLQLDLSAYQSGLYLIRVQSEGLPDATKRVVLQRN